MVSVAALSLLMLPGCALRAHKDQRIDFNHYLRGDLSALEAKGYDDIGVCNDSLHNALRDRYVTQLMTIAELRGRYAILVTSSVGWSASSYIYIGYGHHNKATAPIIAYHDTDIDIIRQIPRQRLDAELTSVNNVLTYAYKRIDGVTEGSCTLLIQNNADGIKSRVILPSMVPVREPGPIETFISGLSDVIK